MVCVSGKVKTFILVGLGLLLFIGCSETRKVPTDELLLNAKVVTDDNQDADVTVSLEEKDALGNYVLRGGDRLEVTAGNETKKLKRESVFGFTARYSAKLSHDESNEYIVSFTRSAKFDDAPDSRVTVPEEFTILDPQAGAVYRDNDIVTIRWFPTDDGDDFSVAADPTCDHSDGTQSQRAGIEEEDGNEDGLVDIAVEDILANTREQEEARIVRCDIKINVKHTREGSVDAAFKGGSIRGIQRRSITVEFVPL